jgi:hypothetical protein
MTQNVTRAGNLLALCILLGMGGCAYPSSPQSHTDRATLAACRDNANEIYNRGHRGEIYSISQVGLPYSASYINNDQINHLAEQYTNDRIIDDCVRNSGTETNRDEAAPAPADQP